MTTTYKGYKITQCASDRFIIRLNGANVTTVQGSLSCAQYAIDTGYDDMTPVDAYEGLDTEQTAGDDLYLDPIFTVEGDDFVFEAHDDNGVDCLVRVTFDDVAAFIGLPPVIDSIWEDNKDEMHMLCQQIVDRYQTGTTSYDVDIKHKKVETLEISEYKCKGRKYKVLKQLSPYFGKTMKEVSILSIQGITRGVCFEVLQGGEWDEVSFLFSELEEQK